LKSQKHKEGKERLKRKEVRERDIIKQLTDYNKDIHVVGENIAENTQVFRVGFLLTTWKYSESFWRKLDIVS